MTDANVSLSGTSAVIASNSAEGSNGELRGGAGASWTVSPNPEEIGRRFDELKG